MKRDILCLAAVAVLCVTAGQSRGGPTYDAASDFSITHGNPNGVWRHGYEATLGGSFTLYTLNSSNFFNTGLQTWQFTDSNVFFGTPLVSHNPSSSVINFGSTTYQPSQLAFSPGPTGLYSVIRFTSPMSGSYQLAATFSGIDFVGPTTSDVHVLLNGTAIFNRAVNGFGPGSGPSFSTNLALSAGDTVDLAVGFGADGHYDFDTTGIAATLSSASPVPEPAGLILFALGGAGALAYRAANRQHRPNRTLEPGRLSAE